METWKQVVGFGKYEANEKGEIRNKKTRRVLKPAMYKSHYRQHVTLITDDGLPRTQRVHVIICKTFHGEKPSVRHHAAHNNGDFNDNRPANLRWATPEENQADRILHGTDIRGEEVHLAKLKNEYIPIIKRLCEMHVPFRVLAYAFQVDTNSIFLIKKGKTWKHVK
jgi:hypothetical protein